MREAQHEKKKQVDTQKNNPQEDMLFIQKEFRTLTQCKIGTKIEMERLIGCHKKGELPISSLADHHVVMKNYYL